MSKKIFVGGLSWGTTDQSLREAFEQFGEVADARVIKDRDTGRSRGFGFVTFEDEASVAEAIEKMNDSTLDGRTIRVSEAEERQGGAGGGGAPRPPRREGGYGGGGYGGGGGGYGGGGGRG
ncbi:MAG: RNA-binding protein, partial [Deltaproteobacteria bacterium]|nr:RNA-binding protein [Deltaproteobacteria bacterium]